ncbi:MAG: phage tail tape measure protein [Prevotella sp.]|nr:phage tail tape measure protein [Prevotella sp.]
MAISENIKSSISVSINDGDARQRLEALRQRIARLNKERETLMQKPLDLRTDKEQKRLETLTRQLTSANKELTRVRAVGTEVVNTLGKLDTASAKELERTIKSLRREMESGSIERGSELWNKYSTALRAAENELEAVREEMRGVGTDTETNIGGSLKGIGSFVEKLTNAFQRMRAWAEPYVEAFAAIDDEMVGVMKYTGLARTEVEQLDQALLQINTRTTHEQLLQLAQDAGRLGIQSKEDILAFVRAADTINLALGEDLGEDAIRNIAKLAQIFGDAEQLGLERAMLATASTINELAQSSTAAEPYLAEFASRLGSIGATAGLTQAQILAYASVMDQSGVNVERAATALQNVIMRLYQDPAKAAEVAGLNVKAFTDLIRTDANEALLQWAQAIELAQALASVALSAINAYSSAVKVPLVGTILAPIAAATAIAAGMLQVATIRKQHEAQAQGYLKGGYVNDPNDPNQKDYIRGGYTQKGNRHKPAGIVHAGEFVATSEAVQSPTLRPMLDLIDQAQKRGTISRLTPADLITTAAGTIALRPASPATNTGSAGVPARTAATAA